MLSLLGVPPSPTATITAISEAADIPVPTIYSAFGNKAAILKDITQRAVAPLDVKGLAPAMTVEEGVDVYVTLVLPEIYHSLVVERGWSPDRYETWLGDNLVRQLLGTR